ncbi:MAG: hypothetical protein M3123_02440, partial [Actinomycetota bacterium]|nr:hypothetical protein [Actinomycetota bacterium]
MRARGRAVRVAVVAVAALPAALAVSSPTAAAEPAKGRLPALPPAGQDGLDRARAADRISEAQYALERALALFLPERAR